MRLAPIAGAVFLHLLFEPVFSEWEQTFKNPMTTAAAIDRLVHHSAILEFAIPSYRTERAGKPTQSSLGSESGPVTGSSRRERAEAACAPLCRDIRSRELRAGVLYQSVLEDEFMS